MLTQNDAWNTGMLVMSAIRMRRETVVRDREAASRENFHRGPICKETNSAATALQSEHHVQLQPFVHPLVRLELLLKLI